MGLIATRSLNQPIPGILELVERAEHRVRGGQLAYGALERLRANKNDVEAREMFDRHWQDLGHGLLLKRYRDDILNATPQEISQAAMDTVPRVMPLFWTFRVMAGLGFYLIAFFALAFYYSCRNNFQDKRWFLQAGPVDAAGTVDRDRVRLVRGRVWSPAVGGRWRAADLLCSIGSGPA